MTQQPKSSEEVQVDWDLHQRHLEWILASIDEVVVGLDDSGNLRFVSPSVSQVLGVVADEVIGRNVFELLDPNDHEDVIGRLARWTGRHSVGDGPTVRLRHGAGGWVDMSLKTITGPEIAPFSTIVIGRLARIDDADRRVGSSDYEDRLARMASAFVYLPAERIDDGIRTAIAEMGSLEDVDRVAVFVIDVDEDEGRELLRKTHEWAAPGLVSRRLRKGRSGEGLLDGAESRAASPLLKAMHRMEVVQIRDLESLDDSWRAESEFFRERGTNSFVALPLLDEGLLSGFISFESVHSHNEWSPHHLAVLRSGAGIIAQALARQAAEEDLAHRARHDSLTGLGNRWDFLDHLGEALSTLEEQGDDDSRQWGIAVLLFDLDRFKVVNDSLGHTAGDQMLRAVAQRLDSVRRPEDILARLGGDELVVLCKKVGDADEAVAVAEQMQQVLVHPMDVSGHEVFVTTSVGVAFTTSAEQDSEELLKGADAAMFMAKARGRNRVELFDDELRELTRERLSSETALKRAVLNHELTVYYQPEFSMPDGKILGAEALVRWRHPARGLLAAVDFIDMAEETGAILDIGPWVLEEASRQLGDWQSKFPGLDFIMRVNLSTRQMVQPDLVSRVESALGSGGSTPEHVCLEITETTLMVDMETSLNVLRNLSDLGVELAIDDFGTGYSSLSYLKQLPVDILKIDRSFVEGLGRDPDDTSIVSAIVSLASSLGLDVTAEGVETKLQYDELVRLGVKRAQGFLLGRPVPANELELLLEQQAGLTSPLDRECTPVASPTGVSTAAISTAATSTAEG